MPNFLPIELKFDSTAQIASMSDIQRLALVFMPVGMVMVAWVILAQQQGIIS